MASHVSILSIPQLCNTQWNRNCIFLCDCCCSEHMAAGKITISCPMVIRLCDSRNDIKRVWIASQILSWASEGGGTTNRLFQVHYYMSRYCRLPLHLPVSPSVYLYIVLVKTDNIIIFLVRLGIKWSYFEVTNTIFAKEHQSFANVSVLFILQLTRIGGVFQLKNK